MPEPKISLSQEQIAAFSRRWRITELAVFGSVLREDFRQDSDIDVLVTFAGDAGHSLLDLVQMQDELANMLGHPVDLVEAEGLRNPFRRREILRTKEVIYAA